MIWPRLFGRTDVCESLLDLSGAVHGSIGTHVLHGSVALMARLGRACMHGWGSHDCRGSDAQLDRDGTKS